MKLVQWGLLISLLVGQSGCGATTYQVSGTVTFDGQPVADGYIGFDQETLGAGAGGTITNGSYSVQLPAGEAKVRITASKMVPLPPGVKGMYGKTEEMQSYIPDKYNTNTELKADIKGSTTLDFDLKSH